MEFNDVVKERISKDTIAFLEELKVPQSSIAGAINIPAVVFSKVKKWKDPKYATSLKEKHWLRLRDISNKKIVVVNETTIKILDGKGRWVTFDLADSEGKPGRPRVEDILMGERPTPKRGPNANPPTSPLPSDPEEKLPEKDDLIDMEETSKLDPSFPGPSDYSTEQLKGDLILNKKVTDSYTDILLKLDRLQKQVDSLEQVIRKQKFYAGVTLSQTE